MAEIRLSFVRADVYEALRNRLMLGMKIGNCQLSKLYAYNGLYYSNGKVIHYQVPLFSEKTKAEWSLSLDSAIADALELGALRTEEYVLPEEVAAKLNAMKPDALPDNILPTLAAYYLANRQPDSEWVVLPVTNMEAYLGSTSLSRQYLPMIPKELMERKTTALGVSVYKMLCSCD